MPVERCRTQPVGVLLDDLERLDAALGVARAGRQGAGAAVGRLEASGGSGRRRGRRCRRAGRPRARPAGSAGSAGRARRRTPATGAARRGRCCGRPGAPRWSCPGPAGRRAGRARRSGTRRLRVWSSTSKPVGQTRDSGVRPGPDAVVGLLQDAAEGFQREIHPVIGAPERRPAGRIAANRPNGARPDAGRLDLAGRGSRSRRLLAETRDRRSSACRPPREARHSTEGPAQRAACAGDTE